MMEMHSEEASKLIDEFGDLLYEMPFQIPENLILLGRCVSILSGMCTGLYPDFNLWDSLAPYANKLVEAEGGSKWQTILDEVLKMLQTLFTLPGKTATLISTLEQGRLEVRTPTLTREVERLNRSQRKTAHAVVFAAFLLGGVQLYLAKETPLAAGFGVAGLLALLWVLIG
jgi:predicted unusual protein kinase regulating ubiquinone biosynthesis (AarF/ABC1/UbiB family)